MASKWDASTRRSRLPSNWHQLRAKVKARAKGRCEALAHVPNCDGIGTQCDHINTGDDHTLTNLQWLSAPCHEAKTRHEAGMSTAVVREREPHPNTRTP